MKNIKNNFIDSIGNTPLIKLNNNNRHSLDSSTKVICYFLKQISENRCKIITKEIKGIFDSYSDNKVIREIVENKIGYQYGIWFVHNMLIVLV